MKILFLHGWQSVPGGVKPTYLRDHGHQVINPKLPDDDFAEAVQIAQAEFDRHQPQVVVGSSRGGAVAMNIQSGAAQLVLLCPAWRKWGCVTAVKRGTIVIHSRADDVIPFADSEELVRNSNLPRSALIEVGIDHRLADPGPLAAMLAACRSELRTANAARDAYRAQVESLEPIAYWPLRDDPLDVGRNGHHGQLHGTPEFVSDDDTGGWARLDGGSFIEVPCHASFSLSNRPSGMTVEVWVRPQNLDFEANYIHWLGKGIHDHEEWGFRVYRNNFPDVPWRVSAYIWNLTGGLGAGAHIKLPIPELAWTHVVACYQPGDADVAGAGVMIYRNGVFQEGPPKPEALYRNGTRWCIYPTPGAAPLRFGTKDCKGYLNGGLAEIAIYGDVLHNDVILRHYRAGVEVFG